VGFANHRRGILPKGPNSRHQKKHKKTNFQKEEKAQDKKKNRNTQKSPNNTSKTEGLLQQSYCVPQVHLGGFLLFFLAPLLFVFLPPENFVFLILLVWPSGSFGFPPPNICVGLVTKKASEDTFFDRPTVFVFVQLACSALRANPLNYWCIIY
jgi:hypothetical protein